MELRLTLSTWQASLYAVKKTHFDVFRQLEAEQICGHNTNDAIQSSFNLIYFFCLHNVCTWNAWHAIIDTDAIRLHRKMRV